MLLHRPYCFFSEKNVEMREVKKNSFKEKKLLLVALSLFIVSSACGSKDTSESDNTLRTPATTTQQAELDAAEEHILSPADIYDSISSSVVYIDTPDGTGSGIILSNGYVLTNAHVVSLHSTVRVWSHTKNHASVPVFARDWVRDLALVGPFQTDLPALSLVSKKMNPGDQVFLIGFPGESESQPIPSITSGIVSRTRSDQCSGLEFLQTDALIAGGQSGGALVDSEGDLIGISGLGGFTEANFALVLSATDALEGLSELETGTLPLIGIPDGLSTDQRAVIDVIRQTEMVSTQSVQFLLSVDDPETAFEATATPTENADLWLGISNLYGEPPLTDNEIDSYDYLEESENNSETNEINYLFIDEYYDGPETVKIQLDPGTYFVNVGVAIDSNPFATTPAVMSGSEIHVVSSLPLIPVLDTQGLTEINLGASTTGIFSSMDVDYFKVNLTAGLDVRIRVDSISDPLMSVYYDDVLVASNDDSGSGLYGVASEVNFTPHETGDYVIAVTSWAPEVDGYTLTAGLASSESFCGNDWWPRE